MMHLIMLLQDAPSDLYDVSYDVPVPDDVYVVSNDVPDDV